MWKQKIGISVGNNYGIPTVEVIKMLAGIGFDAISPEWQANVDIAELCAIARGLGMEVQSLHAPFGRSADMWNEGEAGELAVKELIASLDDCAKCGIPILVVHTWIGFDYIFDKNSLCFDKFDALVARAAELGVKIAFENTEGDEYLFALMEHFEGNDTVGFCWDSGHEICYNHSRDLLALLGDRLIMTHLNDNLGISRFDGRVFWTDDLHLLPYDGVADWDNNIARLKAAKHIEILNFELNKTSKPDRHDNDVYEDMTLERYFAEAYKRACRVAYRFVR